MIHNPESILFAWAQDEEEGAMESQDDIITQICQAVLSNGENGCAFVRRKNSSSATGDDIAFNSNSIEYLAGKYESDKIEINTIVSVVDVTMLASSIRNTLSEETTSELILYVGVNGEIGFCTPQQDYSEYSPLAEESNNADFLEKFKTDYLLCKTDNIFNVLQNIQPFARQNQRFELSIGGKVYSLDNNTLKEETSSDAVINAGNWTDGNVDMKMRVGFNSDGILQFTALGIRNNLTLAAGKSATLNGQNSVALNMLAKNNALLQEYSISDILATPNDVGANLDSEKFPDEKKVEIKKDAAFMKILCEAGGIGLSFLKTAEIEQPVYLASEASTTIKAPPIGTGALEAGAMAVTDITSMVTTIHDLVTDKQARTDAVAGLKAIKDQVVDQPTVLFPILGEVALQELTGTGKDGYKEMLNGTTDEGRKGHLITKTSVRTTVSVFTSGKFLAKLPDMAIEMAKKMPKAKLWLRFRSINDDLAETLLTKFDELSDGGNKFLDDFVDASDDAIGKFLDNPELVDAWKKMDELNADDVIRRNPDAIDAFAKKVNGEKVPEPDTYLDADYVQNHLSKFDDGAVRFTTDAYPTLGNKEAFVIPKSEFDNLMIETGGDLALIEKKLALNDGTLTGKNAVIAWVKKKDFGEIKMPSGNEAGAIPGKWIPGGKTAGGVSECVLDLSNPDIPKVLFPF